MTADTRAPVSDADRVYVRGLFPELEQISDRTLETAVVEIWVETWKASDWDRIEDTPKNPETVSPSHTLVPHTRAVTINGITIARSIAEFHGLAVNLDYVIAGCNLHDVSKLVEYDRAGGEPAKSRFGDLVQHGMYGVHMAITHNLPLELAHIISSHTIQSRLPPKTIEAVIVHYADYVDSDALMIEAGKPPLLIAAR